VQVTDMPAAAIAFYRAALAAAALGLGLLAPRRLAVLRPFGRARRADVAWAGLGQDPSARTLVGGAFVLGAGAATICLAPRAVAARARPDEPAAAVERRPAAATLPR
jgi:hypothetical protein